MGNKILIGRILIVVGVIAGLMSNWFTLKFTWNPLFSSVNLPGAETHSNYHAFREAMLALAANLLILRAAIKGPAISNEAWNITMFVAILYFAGWWLAWPIWGYHAPVLAGEIIHLVATVGGLAGLILIRPKVS